MKGNKSYGKGYNDGYDNAKKDKKASNFWHVLIGLTVGAIGAILGKQILKK